MRRLPILATPSIGAARALCSAHMAALALLLSLLALASCAQETPDIDATVSAAMEATATAETSIQATIDASVVGNGCGPSSHADAGANTNAGNSNADIHRARLSHRLNPPPPHRRHPHQRLHPHRRLLLRSSLPQLRCLRRRHSPLRPRLLSRQRLLIRRRPLQPSRPPQRRRLSPRQRQTWRRLLRACGRALSEYRPPSAQARASS